MKKQVFISIFILLGTTAFNSFAQNAKSVAGVFPKDFLGEWQGSLFYFKANNTTDTVAMELNVLPTAITSEYSWQIIYGTNKKDNRPYTLKPVDSVAGKWIIDEDNGIKLSGVFKGGRFSGAFAVQGNIIVNSYYLQGEELHVEFYSFKLAPTGKTGNGTEESPSVDLFDIRSFQKAVLKRKF